MKLNFARHDLSLDGMSSPSEEMLASQRYSEWHHFTFSDDAAGLCGIVNVALSGDVRHSERGRCALSLVTHEADHGWTGTMNVIGPEEARYEPPAIDLSVANSSVRFRDGAYHIDAALRDGSIRLAARWEPCAEAIRIENMGGFINTFIVPRLDVHGGVTIRGREHRLSGALGYHDHNWGAWDWSRDLGWNWGYLLEAGSGGVAIVFGQVTDASRSAARTELVLIVWRGSEVTHVFLDEAVVLETFGRYAGNVPRVPGVMALLTPGRVTAVPERLTVKALDGNDFLHIECDVRDAIQRRSSRPLRRRR